MFFVLLSAALSKCSRDRNITGRRWKFVKVQTGRYNNDALKQTSRGSLNFRLDGER